MIEEGPAITTVAVPAGGCGIHNGRLWHGSDRNASPNRPRRGLGIHFCPAEARFREADGRTLAHKVREASFDGAAADDADDAAGERGCDMSPDLFPVTFSR